MISRTAIAPSANSEASFGCLAVGYPSIRFVTWQTATGEGVNGTESFSQQNLYERILVNTLGYVDPLTCRLAGGYVCIYDNGRDNSTAITSQVLGCPVGESPHLK